MGGCVTSATTHKTLLFGLVYDIQYPVQGSTLNPTYKLLCAAVRGIIQRKDPFVLKLLVNDEQVSWLVEIEDIAKNKCGVTIGKDRMYTVLELRPHCEYPYHELCMMHYM